ncbi:MAG: DUF2889 domain-containing protein [Desulfotomaculaceae bacterium]|nr:DUF2889 domain-containing protein [Desulfotomaculaceae bacterium]
MVHFKDYFHEMKSTVTFDSDFTVILAAKAQIIKVPWDLCYEVASKMEGLAGLKIQSGIKEQVQRILGGAMGCVHLVELAMDSITAVVQLRDFHLLPKTMPYKEKMENIRKMYKGICHTYSSNDKNPKLLRENLQSQLN